MKQMHYLYHCRLLGALSGGVSSEDGAVLLKDGRILEVSETSAPEKYPDAETFDCKHRTMLPGLIDAHTHLTGLRNFSVEQLKDPMKFFYKTLLFAQKYLDYGFTTIRDCGSFLRVSNKVRDAFSEGLGDGPRILSCGLILMPTEDKEDDPLYTMYAHADGAAEWAKAARKELAEQADFVKIMASGSAFDRYGVPKQAIILKEELHMAAEVTERKHSYIAAHAHADEAIAMCIEEHTRTIEHASFIGKETTKQLQNTPDVWLIPTVSAFYQNPDTTPEEYQYLIQKLKDMLGISAECLRYTCEIVPDAIGFGTDSCPGMDQYEMGIEFIYRNEILGIAPLEILKQATVNSAAAIGLKDEIGEIKPRLAADLILVNGKPDADIHDICKKPAAVWRNGKLVRS